MIIISIPYISDEFVIQSAAKYPKYWHEFRLDYSQKPYHLPRKIINERSLITLRSICDGGKYDFSLEEKIRFFKKLISDKNCYCDLELNETNEKIINNFPASNLVLSYHDYSEEINFFNLETIINKSNSINSAFLKIAININHYTDFNILSNLIKLSRKPVIFAGMGKLGKISRILYKHLGSVGTYAGLEDNPTATGQLFPKEIELYNIRSISKHTQIGGIIGETQIKHSLGLAYYNRLFQQKHLNAVYIPFFTDDVNDLWNWINTTQISFYGFSITMPFKKLIPEKLGYEIANLYIPKTVEMFNSDKIAFERSLEILNILRDHSVLIFGSGSTAEIALKSLKNYNNVIICSRNKTIGIKLAKEFNRNFVQAQSISNKKYHLFVNCTPLGSQNEDILKLIKLPLPYKVIDLPYQQKNTLLINMCIENEIDYIDGKNFWKLQSAFQQEKFLSVLSESEV